jgi:uncharacterized protein YkwD
MRYLSMALAGCAALVLLGCQSESTNNSKRAEVRPTDAEVEGPPVRATSNRGQPTLVLKGVPDPKINPNPDPNPKGVVQPNAGQFDTNLVRMLNELRAKANQPPLSFNGTLTKVAQEQAKVAAKGMQPEVNKASARIREEGYKQGQMFMASTAVRELNAATVYGQINAQAVGQDYKDIGIGIDVDASNNHFVVIILAGEQKQQ